MELKKYKKKRIVPQGWEEITLEDVFRTSSGATPLSTEVSYYANGTIPWINSGELDKPYIYNTMNFISQKGFENSSRHYKIFCVNGNTGFRNESRIFYFIHLQNEEDYERKESSSA